MSSQSDVKSINYHRLSNYILDRMMPAPDQDQKGWRERILFTLLFSMLLLGFTAYLGAFLHAAQQKRFGYFILLSVFYGLGMLITFIRPIPYPVQFWSSMGIFYGLSISSFIFMGPIGIGRTWLF